METILDATSAARTAIKAALNEMTLAFGAGELHKIADFYCDDAVMVAYKGDKLYTVTVGSAAIQALWQSIPGPRQWQLTITYLTGAADSLCHIGQSLMENHVNGKDYHSQDDIVIIWQRQADGSYKIQHDITLLR